MHAVFTLAHHDMRCRSAWPIGEVYRVVEASFLDHFYSRARMKMGDIVLVPFECFDLDRDRLFIHATRLYYVL
jgi:hypothetical protein